MMLNCIKCLTEGGGNSSTMLIATIIGKIMESYRFASQTYVGLLSQPLKHSEPPPLPFKPYKMEADDSRWFEVEILLRELRKVEELFARFQNVCRKIGAEADAGVHGALTTYLGQSLYFTLEALRM